MRAKHKNYRPIRIQETTVNDAVNVSRNSAVHVDYSYLANVPHKPQPCDVFILSLVRKKKFASSLRFADGPSRANHSL